MQGGGGSEAVLGPGAAQGQSLWIVLARNTGPGWLVLRGLTVGAGALGVWLQAGQRRQAGRKGRLYDGPACGGHAF